VKEGGDVYLEIKSLTSLVWRREKAQVPEVTCLQELPNLAENHTSRPWHRLVEGISSPAWVKFHS
jgi:hypothetical protein